jgi:preprotein translocase subunit SecG
MDNIYNSIQIIVSVTLILVILFQVREMGTGLFGSARATYRVRRGLEKTLFQFTIVLVVVFLLVSILSVRQPEFF